MKRKLAILAIALATASSITACDLQFTLPNNQSISMEIPQESYKKIYKAVEKLDTQKIKDNFEEYAEIAETIIDIGKEVASESEHESVEFQAAKLIRVVDGDTIVVEINNEEYTVRLIGINTPESVAPDSYRFKNSEEGVLASDYTKDLLKNVETVYLQKDTSETDRYDRLLRYVWVEIPEDKHNINEIATKMVNGLLLLDHVAEPVQYEPDTEYADDFDYIYDNM